MMQTTLAMHGRIGRRMLACLALAAPLALPLQAHAVKDRLDTAAFVGPKAAGAMMTDVVRAGSRLVAVGEHGIILYSDTNGKTWRQAEVPVSVTLNAVHFPAPRTGWAVGHDGVILRSADGGVHWSKQFDGNQANALVLAAARQREAEARTAAAGTAEQAALREAERALEDAQAGAKFGPSRPLFDVWFKDESEGTVVGAFGQIFHTADGGKTWAMWGDRLANPDGLHLNAISATPQGVLLIAGEAGKVYRSVDGGVSWKTRDTGYAGQLYGVMGIEREAGRETLIAFGFGGRVFRSTDDGASWNRVALEESRPLVAGQILPDGRIGLLSYDGRVWIGDGQGQGFKSASDKAGMAVAAFAPVGVSAFILAGEKGTRIVPINNTTGMSQP